MKKYTLLLIIVTSVILGCSIKNYTIVTFSTKDFSSSIIATKNIISSQWGATLNIKKGNELIKSPINLPENYWIYNMDYNNNVINIYTANYKYYTVIHYYTNGKYIGAIKIEDCNVILGEMGAVGNNYLLTAVKSNKVFVFNETGKKVKEIELNVDRIVRGLEISNNSVLIPALIKKSGKTIFTKLSLNIDLVVDKPTIGTTHR